MVKYHKGTVGDEDIKSLRGVMLKCREEVRGVTDEMIFCSVMDLLYPKLKSSYFNALTDADRTVVIQEFLDMCNKVFAGGYLVPSNSFIIDFMRFRYYQDTRAKSVPYDILSNLVKYVQTFPTNSLVRFGVMRTVMGTITAGSLYTLSQEYMSLYETCITEVSKVKDLGNDAEMLPSFLLY
jgi:hypothetical protein